jgi:hypothetical protein
MSLKISNIMNDKKIIWEKWRDPFIGYDENEINVDDDNFFEDGDFSEETNDDQENLVKRSDPVRVIATPMGIIPYNEYTASSKIFNFWTGHTNFTIVDSIAYLIETTDGVETLDIFTRYRFRIGIGKAFQDRQVMQSIEKKLCNI